MTWPALLSGAVVASGLWLLLGTLRRTPPSLATPLGAGRVGVSVAARREASPELDRRRNAARGRGSAAVPTHWGVYRDLTGDLRVVDYSIETIVFHQILTTVTGLLFPVILLLVILPAAGLSTPPTVVLLLAVAMAAGGFYLPLQSLRWYRGM
jgi:hypothetical protein